VQGLPLEKLQTTPRFSRCFVIKEVGKFSFIKTRLANISVNIHLRMWVFLITSVLCNLRKVFSKYGRFLLKHHLHSQSEISNLHFWIYYIPKIFRSVIFYFSSFDFIFYLLRPQSTPLLFEILIGIVIPTTCDTSAAIS
jgi:hypothetical protein